MEMDPVIEVQSVAFCLFLGLISPGEADYGMIIRVILYVNHIYSAFYRQRKF